MEIALVIVGGLVLMTVFASYFDYLGKKKKKVDSQIEEKVANMEQKFVVLEGKILERDERISQLESELSFINKLIEDKSKK